MIKAKNTPTHNAAQIQKMFLNQIKAKDFFFFKTKIDNRRCISEH